MPAGYQATLISAQGDGSALASSTTATSILPGQAKYILGASFLSAPGQVLHVKAAGRISNIVTTPGTLTLEVRFGSVVVASSGAMALNTTAKTNVAWYLDWLLTLRAVGASTSANFMHQGTFQSESVLSSPAGTMGCHGMPDDAPAVGTGFDSTAAQTVDLFATWSVSNAANSIQLHQYTLNSWGP